jgi:hypothetical protein
MDYNKLLTNLVKEKGIVNLINDYKLSFEDFEKICVKQSSEVYMNWIYEVEKGRKIKEFKKNLLEMVEWVDREMEKQ